MLNDSSASQRDETTHSVKSTRNNTAERKQTINVALKRRAQSVINDKSIDAQSRLVIRYALEINDPWLPELVRCIEAGENLTDRIKVLADAFAD